MPQKDGLSKKKIALEYHLSWIIWWCFFSDGKWKMIFLKKYMETWYFLYICIIVTNMILPFCKKIKDYLLPKKSDWHSTTIHKIFETNSRTILDHLHWRFHILLSNEKKTGNLIYRIEIWLLFQFIWLEVF